MLLPQFEKHAVTRTFQAHTRITPLNVTTVENTNNVYTHTLYTPASHNIKNHFQVTFTKRYAAGKPWILAIKPDVTVIHTTHQDIGADQAESSW